MLGKETQPGLSRRTFPGRTVGLRIEDGDRALSHVQGHHHGIPDALLVPGSRFELVHHEFDEVGYIPVQGFYFGKMADLPVDAHLRVSLAAQRVEKLAVMALAPSHQGSEQQAFPACIFLDYKVHYLLVRIADKFLPRDRRIGRGRPGVEQAEEIRNLGYGAHGTPGVVAGGLLLYGDDGAEALDAFHLRLVQDAHEMFGIGRQRIHVTPLAFGIYGVESQ